MNLFYFNTLDSTNLFAKRNIDIYDDKSVIYCDFQTNGRGRFDRKWISNRKDNIFMSFILKPKCEYISQLPFANLTQYLCVVLSKVLESYKVTPQIKWPNDVMINEHKISGILAECIWNGKDFKGLVLGIGVNLNYKKEDFVNLGQKATSLNLETGQKINRDEFLNKLVSEFFKSYDEFMQIGFPLIKKEYVKRFLYLNREICVNILNNRIYGKISAINDDGTIDIVEKETLCVRRVNIGDLTCQTL